MRGHSRTNTLEKERALCTMRKMYLNGRWVVESNLLREFVEVLATVQAVVLSKSNAIRAGTNLSYSDRAFVGMAGELAFHFFAKRLWGNAALTLPTLKSTPVDHQVDVNGAPVRFQTKTQGCAFDAVSPGFRISIEKSERSESHFDWYALTMCEPFKPDLPYQEYVRVILYAVVKPSSLTPYVANHRNFGRSVRIANIGAEASPLIMCHDDTLPWTTWLDAGSYGRLCSENIDDRFLEALILVGSPVEALRLLDDVTRTRGMRAAIKARSLPSVSVSEAGGEYFHKDGAPGAGLDVAMCGMFEEATIIGG